MHEKNMELYGILKFDIELNLESSQLEIFQQVLTQSLKASSNRHRRLLKRVKELELESKRLWNELDLELAELENSIKRLKK